jgi:quercetin dioxygenase-like cupin family protein
MKKGLPTRTYRAGESGVIDGGRVHEGINNGKTPVRVFATFVVPKTNR